MKLSVKEDIDAPIEEAFAVLTDFDAWERAALRRGADVIRTDKLAYPAPGMGWNISFPYRGKTRSAVLTLAALTPQAGMDMSALSPSAKTTISIKLEEKGPQRTSVHFGVNITPRTFRAGVFLLLARLFRARLTRRLGLRVTQFSMEIETRCYITPR